MWPIIYSSPSFALYSYPFMMGMAWGIAYVLAPLYFGHSKSQSNQLIGLFLSAFLGAWIGAKLLFLWTLSWGEVSVIAQRSSFWLGGGMVFYGGFIGSLVMVIIFSKWMIHLSLHRLLTLIPLIPIGHAVGRIGCLLAGCCYGTETTHWWGIHLHGVLRHPVQLYESLCLVILFCITHYLVRSKSRYIAALIIYLSGYALIRFVLEFYRGDTIRGIYAFGLSTSQWIAMGLALAGGIIYLFVEFPRREK